MGTAAAVQGDRIEGLCPNHVVPGALGAPVPAGSLPFSAPLSLALVPTVLIGGRAAAVVGSQGLNTPPHAGLHPTDPFVAPPAQLGQVLVGSPTVLAGGKPLARTGSSARLCATPGQVVGSVASVLVA